MKTTAKNVIREESGKILILVLVLLVVGGLLLTPLLGLMSTGLVAGQVYEKKASELYAADAGVEDAIWRITNDPGLLWVNNRSQLDPIIVNDKSVEVEIYRTKVDGSTHCHIVYMYKILSTAEGPDGSATSVEAVLKSLELDFSDLTGNAITSGGDVSILPLGTTLGEIRGDILLDPDGIMSPSWYEKDEDGNGGYEGGQVKREELVWLTEEEVVLFYEGDVTNAPDYLSDELNVKDHPRLGPIRRPGTLDIFSHQGGSDLILELEDTVYIDGDTTIGKTNQDFTLKLNGQTIFVASESVKPDQGPGSYALEILGKCTIEGPGAIVAIGDIWFGPTMQVGGTQPVLVFSVSGTTHLHPSGEFYGSIIGKAKVELNPANDIIYPQGGFGSVNFPGLIEGKEVYSVESWNIA